MQEDTLTTSLDQPKEDPIQVEDLNDSNSPLGEKLDARKMVIYSEIMNPKYKD